MEQLNLKAFLSGGEVQVDQFGAKQHIHLIDMRQVEQGVEAEVTYSGAGFFMGFTRGGLFQGFAILHKTSWQGPVAAPGFNGASTQQHLLAPHRQAASDDARVLIVHDLALATDVA